MIMLNGQEILTVIEDSISWGGSKDSCCRSFDFSFLYNPLIKDIPSYKAKVGDKVEWVEGNKKLFVGYIENLPYSTDDDQITVSCVDYSARLMRAKAIGRFKGTLQELANNICGTFGLKNGIESDNTHVHNIVSTGDLSYFDVLNTACKVMFERYCLYMDGDTLKLATHEVQNTFEIYKNIRSSSFKQSIEDMVTRVLVIDENGNVLNAVENNDDLEKYGLFQEVYNYSKDSKDNLAEAKKLLKSVTNEGTIICDNDNNCISGRFIKIFEPVNNFQGVFEIQTDRHNIGVDSNMELEVLYVAGG